MNIDDVQSLLWFDGKWHARLRGGTSFGVGDTPEQALEAARRTVVVDDDLF